MAVANPDPSGGAAAPCRIEIAEVSACPVSSVVVYLDRADVTRAIDVQLLVGENEIVVKHLSSAIDSDSIRVEGRGQAVIGEVTYKEKHITTNEDEPTQPEKTSSAAAAATKELERQRTRLANAMARLVATERRLTRMREVLEKLAMKMKTGQKMAGSSARGHGDGENSSGLESSSALLELLRDESLEGVLSFMAFYSKRSRELDDKLATLNLEKTELASQQQVVRENLRLRVGDAAKKASKATDTERTVTINVMCQTQATKATLYLSYVVMEAGWSPQYDLRVFSKDGLLKIHYFALISQSTGEDWEDAPLVLSTAQPSIGGSPPELGTKKLSFRSKMWGTEMPRSAKLHDAPQIVYGMEDEVEEEALCSAGLGAELEEQYAKCYSLSPNPPPPPPDLGHTTAEVKGTITSTSFEIPRRTSIPADRTGHKVSIAIIDLQPSFEYEAVPKLVSHAFLKAQVKNTSPYALLKGPANVFLDNNFISKTSLDDVSPYEDFTCSLGVDPAVRVVYKPVRRFKENAGLFSKWTMVTMKQSIEVKNTRLETVKVKVTDTLPMSSEEKIKVSLLKPELTRKDPTRVLANGSVTLTKLNLLEWQVDIAASSQHTVELTYSVEYPAERLGVNGL